MSGIFRFAGAVFLLLTCLTACKKSSPDTCAAVQCKNGGKCVNGACECLVGYEGSDCSMLSRDKIIGHYRGAFNGVMTKNGVTILADTGVRDLKLVWDSVEIVFPFVGAGDTMFAQVSAPGFFLSPDYASAVSVYTGKKLTEDSIRIYFSELFSTATFLGKK
jgi:hypothetical protein